jgi:hypothetical protein
MERLVAALLSLWLCSISCAGAENPMPNKDNSPPTKFTSRLKNVLVNDKVKETLLVTQMPAKIQASFGKGDNDRLSNPGDEFSAGCVVRPGIARNRLVFAGALADGFYVVVSECGGFVLMNSLRVYDLSTDSARIIYKGSVPSGVINSPELLKTWAAKQETEK